jgi:hypothetical protein
VKSVCKCSTKSQVGGGLGDYVIQAAIDAKDPLVVIDGFGGPAGHDLDEIDGAAGRIREKVYEIIKVCLEPGSLLLPPLRATNALKELPLTQWVVEMDAIYFDISPEMGLQAQQDFQSLVYSDLLAIISFFTLFQLYTSDLGFCKQFLENDGAPFRLQPSAYLAQFRIALTAKCEHFVDCFRSFDADAKELKDARSNAEKAADKSVIDYKRIGKPKSAIMGIYNQNVSM